jgi:predicted TIM-barrel fold metal-dependent hydrolase
MPEVIDVHHHFHSPRYVERHGDGHRKAAPAYAHVLDLTPLDSLREMDAAGVDVAVLSFPGVWFPDDRREGRDSARDLNEFATSTRDAHPGRFGVFAALPVPDVEGTLAEIAYAFDVLGVDGVGISSNYDGVHLGDDSFAPMFDELDRRAAVVYVHAAAVPGAARAVPGLPPHALELPFDTARTIAQLSFGGSFMRWPRITWIFSHGAGVLPMLAHRFSAFADRLHGDGERALAEIAARVHVDTASMANAPAMAAITSLLDPKSQIFFGSDFPYVTPRQELGQLKSLRLPDETSILSNGRRCLHGCP